MTVVGPQCPSADGNAGAVLVQLNGGNLKFEPHQVCATHSHPIPLASQNTWYVVKEWTIGPRGMLEPEEIENEMYDRARPFMKDSVMFMLLDHKSNPTDLHLWELVYGKIYEDGCQCARIWVSFPPSSYVVMLCTVCRN